jgi:rhodanese-related sulfurtransferase
MKEQQYQIDAPQFAKKYLQGELDQAQIIDVREAHEWAIIHLDKAELIPMNSIPQNLHRLSDEKPIYLRCAHGVRSWHVLEYLVKQGYEQVVNVEGGMAEIIPYLDQQKE